MPRRAAYGDCDAPSTGSAGTWDFVVALDRTALPLPQLSRAAAPNKGQSGCLARARQGFRSTAREGTGRAPAWPAVGSLDHPAKHVGEEPRLRKLTILHDATAPLHSARTGNDGGRGAHERSGLYGAGLRRYVNRRARSLRASGARDRATSTGSGASETVIGRVTRPCATQRGHTSRVRNEARNGTVSPQCGQLMYPIGVD